MGVTRPERPMPFLVYDSDHIRRQQEALCNLIQFRLEKCLEPSYAYKKQANVQSSRVCPFHSFNLF
jgi:hypothetical protein